MTSAASPGTTRAGVYFRERDYAGYLRRSTVILIDGAVLLLAWWAIPFGLQAVNPGGSIPSPLPELVWIAACFIYLVLIERSSMRTLGLCLCGVRIVGMDGKQPGLREMTIRFILLLLGPLLPLLDLFWLAGDPFKQTLRDKFGATYVVRQDAAPIGSAPVVHVTYFLFGYRLPLREVQVPYSARGLTVEY